MDIFVLLLLLFALWESELAPLRGKTLGVLGIMDLIHPKRPSELPLGLIVVLLLGSLSTGGCLGERGGNCDP